MGVSRFDSDTRPAFLIYSIAMLANDTVDLAVDFAIAAARAHEAEDERAVVTQVCRLAIAAGTATGELAWLAEELERGEATDPEIAVAGAAITALQSSLLAVAGAVQELRGGPEVAEAAETLRLSALALDDLLPAYQPAS
jgi:ABC-type transport system involved in cytochrome bd biosynthesis fused ATPase/permease subunit